MAKLKRKFIIKKLPGGFGLLHIYHVDLKFVLTQLVQIEGITGFETLIDSVSVQTSPLYDIDEISDEIKEILSAEIPDVFKE